MDGLWTKKSLMHRSLELGLGKWFVAEKKLDW